MRRFRMRKGKGGNDVIIISKKFKIIKEMTHSQSNNLFTTMKPEEY